MYRGFKPSEKCTKAKFYGEKIDAYCDLIRLRKPIGVALLFLPCTWGIGLGTPAGSLPDMYVLVKLLLGAFLTRSAGCVINDALDRDIDRKVARTRERPMAKKTVTLKEAVWLSTSLMLAAFCVLLTLNSTSVAVALVSVPMILSYPLFKRFTHYPQVMLGLTMNMGCIVGIASTGSSINFSIALPLYFGAALWTVFYDTIYGFQDSAWDRKAGVHSLSLKLLSTGRPKMILAMTAVCSCLFFCLSGYQSGQTQPFYLATALVAFHYFYQVLQLKVKDPSVCLRLFKSNQYLGLIFSIGIFASQIYGKRVVSPHA